MQLFVIPFYMSDPKSDQIFPTSLLVFKKKMSDKRGGSPDHPFQDTHPSQHALSGTEEIISLRKVIQNNIHNC